MSEAQGADANGAGKPQALTATATTPAVGPTEAHGARMAQNFSQIVAVLMRDANFKDLRIADLEWLVLPAVVAGQFKIAHAQSQPDTRKRPRGDIFLPVAVALWARVSSDIDKALSNKLDKPVRLPPNQWSSGNIVWLMAVAGDKRAVPTFLKQLGEREFKGQQVKLRAQGADGNVVVKTLAEYVL